MMKTLNLNFLLVLLACLQFACASDNNESTSNTTTTTTTTTTPKTTTTTTSIPITTTSTTTTTTSTTPAPITTTPAPAPFPEPSIGVWNSSCIIVKMATQLNFTYETKDKGTATTLYNVPADAKIDDSDCSTNITQNINIMWGEDGAKHSMTLQFERDDNVAKLVMIYFVLPLTSDHFPNAKENQTIQLLHRGNDFKTPTQMSYHCTRPQRFNLTETVEEKTILGYVEVYNVQTEAFRSTGTGGFSTAHDCDSSETSDIVPIAVGIALASLIMIVLVAYLCARRRSTTSGYINF